MAMTTPLCNFGWRAPDFALPDPDGRIHTRDGSMGANGLVVMFICNHCPYVQAVLDRLIEDVRTLASEGIGCVAINANDPDQYPQDSVDEMRKIAHQRAFPFPYLFDASQAVARAYDAVCTPDFFGFNRAGELQYRGRLDAAGKAPATADTRRELVEAMRLVARTGRGPIEQFASIGCSIKWRA